MNRVAFKIRFLNLKFMNRR